MPRPAPKAARLALVLACAATALCSSCSREAPVQRRATIFQSTVVLTLNDHASDAAFEACFDRLRRIDAAMNMWDESSELARLNARSGRGPIAVSGDLAAVAARGLELAALSGGAFDPTVAPLVKLWGIGGPRPRLPSEAEIGAARSLVDWRRVKLGESPPSIELAPGQGLDFGALAKGYGAEEGGKLLAAMGVRSGLLDVGGCVLVIGADQRGRSWRIGVQDPLSPRGTPLGYFSLRDSSVDTSGVYERFFELGGRRYAHIMDTRTGRPIEGDIVSATVAMPRTLNSDGPPLALLVLGMVEGLALADRMGLAAVLLGKDKRVYLSRAARGRFTIIDTSFSLAN
jgi:thiamine biosynthesis lipoprotein